MAKRIKLKNDMYLDTKYSVHNDTILYDYLNNLSNKIKNPYIEISGTSDYTIPAPGGSFTNYQQIAFNNIRSISGNSFSRNGATIVVNKSCVALVMFSINLDGIGETVQCLLRKNYNTYRVVDSYINGMTNTGSVSFLMPLSEGDVLDVTIGFGNNTPHLVRRSRSYLSVIELLGGGVIKYLKNLIANLIGGGVKYANSN